MYKYNKWNGSWNLQFWHVFHYSRYIDFQPVFSASVKVWLKYPYQLSWNVEIYWNWPFSWADIRPFSYNFILTEILIESLCICCGENLAKVLSFVFYFGNDKIYAIGWAIYMTKRQAEILSFGVNISHNIRWADNCYFPGWMTEPDYVTIVMTL